jgi:hypothetical protein
MLHPFFSTVDGEWGDLYWTVCIAEYQAGVHSASDYYIHVYLFVNSIISCSFVFWIFFAVMF